MTRSRPSHRPSPGQMTLDGALLAVILPTGRALALLQGGRATQDPNPKAPAPAARLGRVA